MTRMSNSGLSERIGLTWPQTTLSGSKVARTAGVLASLATSIAFGIVVAIVGVEPTTLVAVASLAAIPLIMWATGRTPELVVGTIVFSLILVGFETQTPVGTLSPAIVALIVFVGLRLPQIVAMASSPGYRFGTACLVAYVAGQGFQFLHGDAGVAARHMITASSFAAYAALGMYVGARRSHIAAAAIGAATGLLVLAGLALLANLDAGSVNSLGRQILGVTSPFTRNYGLGTIVPIGLLLALCVPWLALATRSPSSLWVRAASSAALVLIWLASLLLFQSRSMVLEVPLGIALAWSLANRRFSTALVMIGCCAAIALFAGLALATSTDVVSTQLRTESYTAALDYFIRNPSVLVVGTNPEQFHLMVNASLTYGSQIPADAPTHNLLIETVVVGGVISAAGLILLTLAPALSMLKSVRRVRQVSAPMALALSAVAIAVLEASVTPAIANSAPLWMALGYGVAAAAVASPTQHHEGIKPWTTNTRLANESRPVIVDPE